MSQTLAVKHRPKVFSDLLGQDVTTTILEQQIEYKEFRPCYLFSGGPGTGKTIFASKINDGLQGLIELDASSSGGVDVARQISTDVKYSYNLADYRIYLIDEVHAASKDFFNALLLVLEECPPKTIFLLCTTDPNKLPQAILSRCQKFQINRVSERLIVERLELICKKEGVKSIPNWLIQMLTIESNGGM
jgi:DNA polymerase-3 subunit gamma/tau